MRVDMGDLLTVFSEVNVGDIFLCDGGCYLKIANGTDVWAANLGNGFVNREITKETIVTPLPDAIVINDPER